jgi:hypothetical protein
MPLVSDYYYIHLYKLLTVAIIIIIIIIVILGICTSTSVGNINFTIFLRRVNVMMHIKQGSFPRSWTMEDTSIDRGGIDR